MSKIIMLDIDGPMIPIRAYWLPNQTKPLVTMFDPVAVSLLNKLIEESGAYIVISSTWRNQGYDEIVATLTKNGIDPLYLHEDWATPQKLTSRRIHEIKWWLEDHPEVTHYVAIDDESLNIDFVPNAVQCNSYEGFSLRNYFEARQFLDAYSEDQWKDKAEHKTLIDFLRRQSVWQLKRDGEKDYWKVRDACNTLFEDDDEEQGDDDANSRV